MKEHENFTSLSHNRTFCHTIHLTTSELEYWDKMQKYTYVYINTEEYTSSIFNAWLL
jgi:hypothetical protein